MFLGSYACMHHQPAQASMQARRCPFPWPIAQVGNLRRMVGYLLEAGNSREAVVEMLATSL